MEGDASIRFSRQAAHRLLRDMATAEMKGDCDTNAKEWLFKAARFDPRGDYTKRQAREELNTPTQTTGYHAAPWAASLPVDLRIELGLVLLRQGGLQQHGVTSAG